MRRNKFPPECIPQQTVRIPRLNRPDVHAPIADCVTRTAEHLNLPPVQVAELVMNFFETIVEQMCRNQIVRIPGFGSFGAMTRFRPTALKDGVRQAPVAFPAFVSSPLLRHEIAITVPPASAPERDKMRIIQRKRSSYDPKRNRSERTDFVAKFLRSLNRLNQPQRLAKAKLF